jgi:hypothetical protein
VNELIFSTRETLQKLEKIPTKYEVLPRKPTDRRTLRHNGLRLKFAKDAGHIADLRGKISYQYNLLQLLISSAGNSSLERLHAETQAFRRTQEKMLTLFKKMYLQEQARSQIHGPSILPAPLITAVEAKEVQMRLSEAFIEAAEQHGTWPEISLNAWLNTAAHWLGKSKYGLAKHQALKSSASVTQPSSLAQAVVDLLKASWIITDIVTVHPQRALSALASEVSGELDALSTSGTTLPTLSSLTADFDLKIFPFSPLHLMSAQGMIDHHTSIAHYERSRVLFNKLASSVEFVDRALNTDRPYVLSLTNLTKSETAISILDGTTPYGFEVRVSFPSKPGRTFHRKF